MKRRNFITAWLVTLLTPLVTPRRARALTIDEWSLTPGQAGEASGIVPPMPSSAGGIVQPRAPITTRTMKWACVCLRKGAHWTIGALASAIATIGQVRHHLVSVHGHNYGELASMSKEQMLNLHDAHHEGRSYGHYHFPATPPNGVDHLSNSSCPGGVCPVPRRSFFGIRRG